MFGDCIKCDIIFYRDQIIGSSPVLRTTSIYQFFDKILVDLVPGVLCFFPAHIVHLINKYLVVILRGLSICLLSPNGHKFFFDEQQEPLLWSFIWAGSTVTLQVESEIRSKTADA